MTLFLAKLPKIVQALIIQLMALLLLAMAVTLLPFVLSPPYPDAGLVMTQALLAVLLSYRLPYWWRIIQFLLPLSLWIALTYEINPWWGLVGFLLLWFLFRNSVVGRIPLYLTNDMTRQALNELIKTRESVRFLDLGCGLGSNLSFIKKMPNVTEAVGVETAWGVYFIAKIRSFFNDSEVRRQDLWQVDLASFDVVYAFLSTEPMARLWLKVKREMKPGAVFVSNSFPVPEVDASEVWQLADRRQTQLYIYQISADDQVNNQQTDVE